MNNRNPRPEIVRAYFQGNDGGFGGGGIYNSTGSRLVISHSVFEANEAIRSSSSPGPGGGGILNTGSGAK